MKEFLILTISKLLVRLRVNGDLGANEWSALLLALRLFSLAKEVDLAETQRELSFFAPRQRPVLPCRCGKDGLVQIAGGQDWCVGCFLASKSSDHDGVPPRLWNLANELRPDRGDLDGGEE